MSDRDLSPRLADTALPLDRSGMLRQASPSLGNDSALILRVRALEARVAELEARLGYAGGHSPPAANLGQGFFAVAKPLKANNA